MSGVVLVVRVAQRRVSQRGCLKTRVLALLVGEVAVVKESIAAEFGNERRALPVLLTPVFDLARRKVEGASGPARPVTEIRNVPEAGSIIRSAAVALGLQLPLVG